MDIFTPKNIKFIGTIVVRDEEDIIGQMIEHHLSQGISDLFITNNSSKDRTKEIISKYPEVRVIYDSDDMTHNQEIHTTKMARLACQFGADWIVHLDADEFWGGLMDLVYENPPCKAVWATNVYIHPPVPNGNNLDSMKHYIDFRGKSKEYKVLHRADPDIIICHGNHSVQGRECGYTNKVFRHHYPIRSYEQFERKVVQGTKALQARGFNCHRWNRWLAEYEDGRLPEIYHFMATEWQNMITNGINELMIRKLLSTCYNVEPEICDIIFHELQTSGLKMSIGNWRPKVAKKFFA